jgi:hypothetical protein
VADTLVMPGPSAWSRAVIAPLSAAVGLLGLAWLAPHVPIDPLVGYVLGFACVSASTLGTVWAWPQLPKRGVLWLVPPAACLLAVIGLGGTGSLEAALVLVCLLCLGSIVGSIVGSAMQHPGHLLFVAIVSSAADALSVLHPKGASAAIVESELALSLLALPWPLLGTDAIVPLLGVGDVVFCGLYVSSARRHGLPLGRTAWALGLALLTTMLVVIAAERAVPALPFMGLYMLLAHPAARIPPAEGRTRAMLALCAVLLLLALFHAT